MRDGFEYKRALLLSSLYLQKGITSPLVKTLQFMSCHEVFLAQEDFKVFESISVMREYLSHGINGMMTGNGSVLDTQKTQPQSQVSMPATELPATNDMARPEFFEE